MASSLALVFMAVTTKISAQGIIYGSPQQPINYSAGFVDSETFIDVNGDGTPDFDIISTSGFSASIAPLGNNSLIAIPETSPDVGSFVAALNQGTSIGSSLDPIPNAQWYNNQTDGLGSAAIGAQALFDNQLVVLGFFAGQPSAYVGFDLVANGNNYYGWMQLSNPLALVNGQVEDWAYESDANTPIQAGAVPEPSTLALLAVGGAALLLRKNHKIR